MFKIARSIPTLQESNNIQVVEASIGQYDSKSNKTIYTKKKELEIDISGRIDNDEYSVHFIITKPFQDYLNIESYDKILIKKENIRDNYITVNGITYLDIILDLAVLKFDKKLIFTMMFRNYKEDIFGTAEVELEMARLTKEVSN